MQIPTLSSSANEERKTGGVVRILELSSVFNQLLMSSWWFSKRIFTLHTDVFALIILSRTRIQRIIIYGILFPFTFLVCFKRISFLSKYLNGIYILSEIGPLNNWRFPCSLPPLYLIQIKIKDGGFFDKSKLNLTQPIFSTCVGLYSSAALS